MSLAPMLAASIDMNQLPVYINDNKYAFEQKLDGHRVVVTSTDPTYSPALTTRGGSSYSRGPGSLFATWKFPPGTWRLDGEMIDKDYWVFDILWTPSELLAHQPLATRRAKLEQFFRDYPDNPFHLIPQAKTPMQKALLAKTALIKNYEGIIVKRLDAPYVPGGRTASFLKAKFVVTADVIVTAVKDDGKESAALGLHRNGKVIPVGRTSLIGKPEVKVGDVVEVRYLYVGANGRLYQPTLLRVRTDKQAFECTEEQLKHVNKNVLEALPA